MFSSNITEAFKFHYHVTVHVLAVLFAAFVGLKI